MIRAAAAFAVCLWAGAALAHPPADDPLAARYAALRAAQAPAPAITPKPEHPAQPAAIRPSDLRVALFRIARPALSDDIAQITAAQGLRGLHGVTLTSGTAGLAAVLAAVARENPSWVGPNGLRVPLVVAEGATLAIGPGEALRLDRAAGAFVLALGDIAVTGGAITGAGPRNGFAPAFNPFVLVTGGGSLIARNARFADLGFGWQEAFGGLALQTQSLFGAAARAEITDSAITGVTSVALSGMGRARITGTRFADAGRSALILGHTRDAMIENSVFLDGESGDAIRLTRGARGTRITDVAIFRPHENGIALKPGASDTAIHAVTIWQPRHNGIRAEAAPCLRVEDSRIDQARFSGIALSGVAGARIADSAISAARHAGLRIRDLPATAHTRVTGTRFARNRSALATAAPGIVTLTGNDFRDQFPRFLDGDVAPMTPALLRDLENTTPLRLTAGGLPGQAAAPAAHCEQD